MKRMYQVFFSPFAKSWVILPGPDADIEPTLTGYPSAQAALEKLLQFVGACHIEVIP